MTSATTKTGLAAPLLVLVLAAAGCQAPAGSPDEFVLATGTVGYPTAAVDPSTGTVYWTWFEDSDGEVDVYLTRLEPGSSEPEEPIRVNTVAGNAAMHSQAPAQVAVGGNGDVYVVWTNRIDVEGRRFPASNLLFARSEDGGRSFAPPVFVNSDAGEIPAGHTFHNLAVARDGTIHVAWLDSRERHRTSPDRGHEHRHAAGSQPEAGQTTGKPTGIHDSSGTQLRIASSLDGGRSFGENRVIAQPVCECCRTSIDLAGDGTIYVAWRHLFEGARDIAVVRSVDGGVEWTDPRRVHADNWMIEGCPHTGPAMDVDGAGRVHVAWYTGAANRRGLWRAVSDIGFGSFGEPELLLAGVPVSLISLALDQEGGPIIAWEDLADEGVRLLTAGGDPDPLLLPGRAPQVATGPGIVTATWMDRNAVKAVVR